MIIIANNNKGCISDIPIRSKHLERMNDDEAKVVPKTSQFPDLIFKTNQNPKQCHNLGNDNKTESITHELKRAVTLRHHDVSNKKKKKGHHDAPYRDG